jgi:hypothetical protein
LIIRHIVDRKFRVTIESINDTIHHNTVSLIYIHFLMISEYELQVDNETNFDIIVDGSIVESRASMEFSFEKFPVSLIIEFCPNL